ncbi:extracellular solute-binding protein [Paenibacillus macquariensis]|uniref:extracellular solute-binding protein n=1 Tax=Paenibacillus macquariensis TaxID=948756 RepID=UPI0007C3BBCD|nr:ABC transporter substrate-binding protein [Paenibacillus macquariensis subsp. macquariensis]
MNVEINKKSMFLILALMLSMSVLFSACSKGDEASNQNKVVDQGDAGNFILGETPLNFSFYGNYDWYTMNPWGQDPATKWIQENKKVTVEAIQSGGTALQKFNTMIASGKLPDVIWGDRGTDVEKLRMAGKLVPLDAYLDKYPNLKKWAGDKTLNMLRSEDGKLYQFPNWYTKRPMGNGGYAINNKIYKDLGSPKLETFDDLYSYLTLVKEKYPKVVPFEVGLSGQGIDFLYAGMSEDRTVGHLMNRAIPDGNVLKSLFSDPVYRESMVFANKLFKEKLITQDAITQTRDQVKEKINKGMVAIYGDFTTTVMGTEANSILKAKDPEDGYTMIWPFHKEGVDPKKVWVNEFDSLGWNVSVITTAAKNPEGIFAYLDWLTGEEGERIIFWGPEGTYWKGTSESGAPLYTETYANDVEERTKLMAIWDTFQWAGNTTFIDESKSVNEMNLPEDKRDWATVSQTNVAWKTSFDATEFGNINPLPDSDEGIIMQQIADIADQVRAKALFAKDEQEVIALLDKAEQDAQNAGYEKLLKFQTQKWQENIKKINE